MIQNPHISPNGVHRAKHPLNELAHSYPPDSLNQICPIYKMGMHNILDGFFASETVIVFIRQDISCISGFIPVRYAYLLLLCKTMLKKCTFLTKNLEHNRHSYYFCISFINQLK